MTQQLLQSVVSLGYLGVILGLAIEIIPSEIVLAYAGYLVFQGHLSFWGAVAAGTVGGLVAQCIVYAIGYYGGRPFLLKYGKFILIKPKHIQLADRWFERHGSPVVFFARFIPVVRHAISIPAGVTRMNLWKFSIYTLAASLPWAIIFINIGMKLGENWGNVKSQAHSTWFIAIALAGLLVAFGIHHWISKKRLG
ncbi:DedA family protein [Paenibacillus aceris]|uniref:Membrane protein DedA with SNARE-associated domain n=1 Tax=Paenibacillus aceris TaxID=869555 RepID=A0ABS4I8W4_9BACL|nr:DedA family protein [Paenibacillus aceris]MBP1967115.1 membrane protein DedA with SNARE-associated domain [Paenibacillus aceris]NHW35527.1 DedA family protein [Paenibacillus aceris]